MISIHVLMKKHLFILVVVNSNGKFFIFTLLLMNSMLKIITKYLHRIVFKIIDNFYQFQFPLKINGKQWFLLISVNIAVVKVVNGMKKHYLTNLFYFPLSTI